MVVESTVEISGISSTPRTVGNILVGVLHIWLVTNIGQCVGFKVLTTVVVKSTVFWDITPCSP
jgi:hypothetical protein